MFGRHQEANSLTCMRSAIVAFVLFFAMQTTVQAQSGPTPVMLIQFGAPIEATEIILIDDVDSPSVFLGSALGLTAGAAAIPIAISLPAIAEIATSRNYRRSSLR
jgi:hypothetical protein